MKYLLGSEQNLAETGPVKKKIWGQKKSSPRDFFVLKKSAPRDFFFEKKCVPRDFFLQKSWRPVIFFSKKSVRPVIFFFEKKCWVSAPLSKQSKTLENVLHLVIYFSKKCVRPVIFFLKKSVCPVIFFSRKSMRPVIFFSKKSARPVIFGDQKSLRPAAVLTGPVSDKFCSLPNDWNTVIIQYSNITPLIEDECIFILNRHRGFFKLRYDEEEGKDWRTSPKAKCW